MKKILRLGLLSLVLGAAALLPQAASAEDYPTRPVILIVPFSPGGPGDITARYVAKELSTELGQPFVIENRPGANGVIAAKYVASKPGDGYTLLQISSSHTANEALYPDRGYELMRDFEPIASLNLTEMVLIARNDLPANTLPELIKYAKANPGKLVYASSGIGSSYHLAAELMKTMAGVQILHVPYKEAAAARTDLIGGHVDLMFDALPASIGLVQTSKVKALATTFKTRSPALPNVPTVAETLTGYEDTLFIGLLAPKKTPTAIVDKLHDAINKILSKPETAEFMGKLGGRPMIMSRPEFIGFLKKDIEQSAHLVKISGAKSH